MSSSCTLLGGFAIGARVSCYDNKTPNAKCQRLLVLALCLVFMFAFCDSKDILLMVSTLRRMNFKNDGVGQGKVSSYRPSCARSTFLCAARWRHDKILKFKIR